MEKTTLESFHIGEVLCVILGNVVLPHRLSRLISLLEFMTGCKVKEYQIYHFMTKCGEPLRDQLPRLDTADLGLDVMELRMGLDLQDRSGHDEFCERWLEGVVAKYGANFLVRPALPRLREFVCPTEIAKYQYIPPLSED